MEAIFELIGAVIGGLFVAIGQLVFLVIELIALVIEFCFLATTKGTTAAKEKAGERRAAMRKRRATGVAASPRSVEPRPTDDDRDRGSDSAHIIECDRWPQPPPERAKYLTLSTGMAVVVGLVLWAGVVINKQIRKQRIATTTTQIERVARDVRQAIVEKDQPAPVEGLLDERDAWSEPLELFLDEFKIGTLIVVRSTGPDRTSGTADDLLSIETVGTIDRDVKPMLENAKELVAELLDRLKADN